MRTNVFLTLFVSIILTSLISCSKDDEINFGETQTNFEVGKSYQTKTNGLLTVQLAYNGTGEEIYVKIYSDNTSNPSKLIGLINYPSIATLPIKKNNYWIVIQGLIGAVTISFTPIE